MKTQDVLNKLEQLNYEDLVKTKELIEELIGPSGINIPLFKVNKRERIKNFNNLILMITPVMLTQTKKIIDYTEFACKVCYLPKDFLEFINYTTCYELFKFLPDLNYVIKCDYRNKDIEVFEEEGKTFISVGYNSLKDVFISKPEILENCDKTLFIFQEISWEAIRLIFNSFSMRLSSGSHTKRHLLSPLDLKLMENIANLQLFGQNYLRNSNIERTTIFNNITNSNYRILLEGVIKYSYNLNELVGQSKILGCRLSHCFELYKILYGVSLRKDTLEILFLRHYELFINRGTICLSISEGAKEYFTSIINKIDLLLSKYTEINKTDVKVNSTNSNKNMFSNKREYSTLKSRNKFNNAYPVINNVRSNFIHTKDKSEENTNYNVKNNESKVSTKCFKKLNIFFKMFIIFVLIPITLYFSSPYFSYIFKIYINFIGNNYLKMNLFLILIGELYLLDGIIELYLINIFSSYSEKPTLNKYIPSFISKKIFSLYDISKFNQEEKLLLIGIMLKNLISLLLLNVFFLTIFIVFIILMN